MSREIRARGVVVAVLVMVSFEEMARARMSIVVMKKVRLVNWAERKRRMGRCGVVVTLVVVVARSGLEDWRDGEESLAMICCARRDMSYARRSSELVGDGGWRLRLATVDAVT